MRTSEMHETHTGAASPQTGRRCGALPLSGDGVLWRVWAPRASAVELVLIDGDRRRAVPMHAEPHGYFRHVEVSVAEGQRYAYRLDGGDERAGPCSLWQPDGPMGPSAVVRPGRFAWSDHGWKGVARADLVFYELHVGTFTPEGTFDAVIPRLAALRELGVTAIELMPVAQAPGPRGWGYDGVLLYAAQNSYGGPHGLARLIDACHAAGLAVFLDVVYNHFGPEGNYLPQFGPYLTDRYRTPWGDALNFDGPGCDAVRDFVLDNARMWLEEFHLDGLRVDAVHAIFDTGARHILRSLQEVADGVAERTGRQVHVVAESDLNDPRLLLEPPGGHGLDAQWADDFHHAIHAFLTGERQGYYSDFGTATQLAAAMTSPFVYAWTYSPFRGRKHGAPPEGLAADRFVVCVQNHDQVGNRAAGDRLAALLPPPGRRLAACLLLLSPYTPLLFMGEEYGEDAPFPYFCSFCDPGLVQAVREGRKREFAELANAVVPDPHAVETFASAVLNWSWPDGTPRAGLRRLYRDLLEARREWPALRDRDARAVRLLPSPDEGPLLELARGPDLRAYFNLSGEPQPLPSGASGEVLFRSELPRYGGEGKADASALSPHECAVVGPAGWRAYR